MFTKQLSNSKDLSDIGNKCSNLARLTEFGFNVPRAVGITFAAFTRFITPLVPRIKTLIQTYDYKLTTEKIRDLIINTSIPNEVLTQIEIIATNFPEETKFAVRSSGVVIKNGEPIMEDSSNKSLAGQYESFLNVPPSEITNAVKFCWASLFNERSLHVFDAKENPSFFESKMSVVVQQMILADFSAVMMTQDPVEKRALLAMETTYGPCEAIVSGKVTGDLITIDPNTMIIYKKELGSKRNRVVYDVFDGINKGSYKLEPTTREMQDNFSIDNKTALQIAAVGLAVEKKFEHPQDIELVIAGKKIYIVQTRNITTSIHKQLNKVI